MNENEIILQAKFVNTHEWPMSENHCGKYKKFRVGSCKFSDISTFSFHPVKPITTAEGGMITTNELLKMKPN